MKNINETIENLLDKEMKKHNIMGDETATIIIELTDAEKATFLQADAKHEAFGKEYQWELEENKLIVNWSEE